MLVNRIFPIGLLLFTLCMLYTLKLVVAQQSKSNITNKILKGILISAKSRFNSIQHLNQAAHLILGRPYIFEWIYFCMFRV